MSTDIRLMVKDYMDWKSKRDALGTLEELAAKYGLSKGSLLYRVSRYKNGPSSDQRGANYDQLRDETRATCTEQEDTPSPAPTIGDE